MEKQNSATEKVEAVITKKKSQPTEKQKAEKRVQVAKQKKQEQKSMQKDKADKQKNKEQVKLEKQKLKQQAKAEREQNKQQARLAHQEKREKAKLEKAVIQEKKAQAKLEKKEKQKSVKAEKLRLKREKQAQRAELNKIKAEKKAQAKADKRQKREERSKRRASRGIGGWLAAVVSLSLAVLVLGSLLTVNMMGGRINMPEAMVDFGYRQNFSELIDYNQNIETNLSKTFVSKDKKEQQKLLIKVSEDSLLAEECLQRLPIAEQNKYHTARLINQIGDYSKYLTNKLIDGQTVSQEEWQTLERLYGYNNTLKQTLAELDGKIAEGEEISKLFKDEKSLGSQRMAELEDMAVSYPQLIYDGPFSDGLNARKPKGIGGQSFTENGAEKLFKSIFAKYDISKVEVVGETGGVIPSYSIVASDALGEEVYAQISKEGGKLIMFEYNKICKEGKLSEEECVKIGSGFLKNLGIDNMQAVWCEAGDRFTTVNYACIQEGVVIYPDIIKLNVCRGEGVVFGMEATNYYLNHTDRKIERPTLTKAEAKQRVCSQMQIESVRLALIPKGNYSEVLTYEVAGEVDGEQYYVYINARSGAEEQIFKVVQTGEGSLLI